MDILFDLEKILIYKQSDLQSFLAYVMFINDVIKTEFYSLKKDTVEKKYQKYEFWGSQNYFLEGYKAFS